MPPRFTIRQVIGTYRRKAFGTRNADGTPRRPAYPADAIVAFYGTLELAEEQPTRGCFESERLLRVLLEGPDGTGRRYARQVPFLIAQQDLVYGEGGSLVVDGWADLQEGDTTIADRVARFRSRRRNAPANDPANGGANADVTAGVTDDPRTGDVRAPRRARNAVATVDGFGDGGGTTPGSRRAREAPSGPVPIANVIGRLAVAGSGGEADA